METIFIADLRQYIVEGLAQRLRPVMMTAPVSLFGLLSTHLVGYRNRKRCYVTHHHSITWGTDLFVTSIVLEMEIEINSKEKIELIYVKE